MFQTDDIIGTVRDWMLKAGQISATPEINARRSAFYVGMQLEELAEKLESIYHYHNCYALTALIATMKNGGRDFKRGDYDRAVQGTLNDPQRAEDFLDGDIDLLWVTAGSLPSQGADGHGAFGAVGVANWKKFPNGVATLDANGKVVKPEGWTPPDLSPFTFLGRQKAAAEDTQLPLVP